MAEIAKVAVKFLVGAIAVATGDILLKRGAEDMFNLKRTSYA